MKHFIILFSLITSYAFVEFKVHAADKYTGACPQSFYETSILKSASINEPLIKRAILEFPELLPFWQWIESVDKTKISGHSQKFVTADFEPLVTNKALLVEKIQNIKRDRVRYERLRTLWSQIIVDPTLLGAISTLNDVALPETYRPGQYGLKRAYRYAFKTLIRLMPKSIKVMLQKLPKDKSRRALVTLAEQVVEAAEEAFNDEIERSTGLSYEERVELLKEEFKSIETSFTELELEKYDISTRVPQDARFWVSQMGFQNQRVTATSKGALVPFLRDKVEAIRLGVPKEYYKTQNYSLMPKYGVISTKFEIGGALPQQLKNVSHYGEDIYVFKAEKTKKRTTFVLGDSLEVLGGHWNDTFIPLRFRSLMGPFLKRPYRTRYVDRVGTPREIGIFWTEAQIFGPIDLSDVEKFIFTADPPSGEFLLELRRHQVKIMHLVESNLTIWTGDKSVNKLGT